MNGRTSRSRAPNKARKTRRWIWRGLPRLRFPIGLILVLLGALFFRERNRETPYFYGFIYGIASSLIFYALLSGLVVIQSRNPSRREKLAGIGLIM